MSVDLNKKLTLPGKKAAYPTKTTMNLMQHESTSQRLPGLILVGIFAVLLLVLVGKFGVYDPLAQYHSQQQQLQQAQAEMDGITAQLADYADVELKYRCYSYGYLTDEEAALVDVLSVVDSSKTIVDGYGRLDSIAVSQNAVSLECTVSSLADVSKIVADFYKDPTVVSVTVGSASNTEDGIRTSLVVAVAKTADSAAGTEGGEQG